MRLLPSGNYILASGSSVKKKGLNRKPGPLVPAAAAAAAAPTPAAGSQAATANPCSSNGEAAGTHKVVLIPPLKARQTLLQSRACEGTAATNGPSAAAHPEQSGQQHPRPRPQIPASVLMSSDVSVRRRKKLHIRKLLAASRAGQSRLAAAAAAAAVGVTGKRSDMERARPMSQRKKFKKNLGPDFLEPSDLGMQYLQNSFEPKCDYCERPASRSPRGKHEDFLICKDCGFKAHPKSCLKYSDELVSRCRESEWQCQYCKDCCMCDKSGDVDSILFCDACDQGYHMACHDPPLASKPDGAWICTSCQVRRKAGVKGKAGRPENRSASDDGFEEESEGSAGGVGSDEEEEGEADVGSPASSSGHQEEASERVKSRKQDPSDGGTDKILLQLQPPLEDITHAHPSLNSKPHEWSVSDVETFIRSIGFPDQASVFREQEVDGIALLLLRRSDLLAGLELKLGPAVKIYGHVQRLQLTHGYTDSSSQSLAGRPTN